MNGEEVEIEPIPGLPHALPPGEELLWQGRPQWRVLARHTFEVPWVAAYFAVFITARFVFALQDGKGLGGALLTSAMVLPLAMLCLGLLALLAWLNARATVYSITSKRVVMRFGVAFPMTFNFPFKRMAAAQLKLYKDKGKAKGGAGDISLQLSGTDRVAWLHLWPHARPWHFKKAQPTLRAIRDAAPVAALLAEAVQAWSTTDGAPVLVTGRDADAPAVMVVEPYAPAHIAISRTLPAGS